MNTVNLDKIVSVCEESGYTTSPIGMHFHEAGPRGFNRYGYVIGPTEKSAPIAIAEYNPASNRIIFSELDMELYAEDRVKLMELAKKLEDVVDRQVTYITAQLASKQE